MIRYAVIKVLYCQLELWKTLKKKFQLSTSHSEKHYFLQTSGTGAFVRQDARLGGQMHHALVVQNGCWSTDTEFLG